MEERQEGQKELTPEMIRAQRTQVTLEYECGQDCRTCPFPGAKCVSDPDLWQHVK